MENTIINVSDLNSIPFLKIMRLCDLAGVNGNKYMQRKARYKEFLRVSEAEAILKTFAEYGLTYERSKNQHYKPESESE